MAMALLRRGDLRLQLEDRLEEICDETAVRALEDRRPGILEGHSVLRGRWGEVASDEPAQAPSCPTMTTEETFWCGEPPRLCVNPRFGAFLR